MITCAKPKSKAGSKVDGRWTAKSGHAEKPRRKSVSLNLTSGISETKNKKTINRNQPVGCKASTDVGIVGPLGHVCRRNEREEKFSKRRKTCRLQSQNGGRSRGTFRGRYNQETRKGVKRKRPVGWRAREGSIIWDLKGSQ